MRTKVRAAAAALAVAALVAVVVPEAWSATGAGIACSAVPDRGTGVACQSLTETPQPDGSTLVDVTLTAPAIFHPTGGGLPSLGTLAVPVHVGVYLPPGYPGGRADGYPTLYLLHGGGATYHEWADPAKGDIVDTLRGSPFTGVVVMPEGGLAGWYSDWAGRTDGSFAPAWETFHIRQLIPWVDANLHTIGNRSGRAIAGVSMGGFGALKYAAAHPDVFSAVGSFSGGTDLTTDVARSIISDSMWEAGAAIGLTGATDGNFRVNEHNADGSLGTDQVAQMAYRLDAVFGTPILAANGAADWPMANPIDRARAGAFQAYGTKLGLYAGGCVNQAPASTQSTVTGPTNSGGCIGPDPQSTEKDALLAPMNRNFDHTLSAGGVNHRFCTGTGTHSWPFWRGDLVDFLRYVYGPAPDPDECVNA